MMFRHMVRQIIKPGEYRDFLQALKAFNASAPTVGLPTYRAWSSQFGDINEVFTEAEYDSLDGHVEAFDRARENPEFMAVFRAMISHIAPSSSRDYPLRPVEL